MYGRATGSLLLAVLRTARVLLDRNHVTPEKLGKVSLATSPSVQEAFERGVALLHSFTHASAERRLRSKMLRKAEEGWREPCRRPN